MIVIKHGRKPELKRWKFKCPTCGCEWIADETEVARSYSYRDERIHNWIFLHAISCCPECEHRVEDERVVDADEYERILMQTDPLAPVRYVNLGDGITTQTEEEKLF